MRWPNPPPEVGQKYLTAFLLHFLANMGLVLEFMLASLGIRIAPILYKQLTILRNMQHQNFLKQ